VHRRHMRLSPMCKVKIVEVIRFPVESKPVSYSWFPFKWDRK
jgi:hypothetical protein